MIDQKSKLSIFNVEFDTLFNNLIRYAISISDASDDKTFIEENLLLLLTNVNDRVVVLIGLDQLDQAMEYLDEITCQKVIEELKQLAKKKNNIELLEKLCLNIIN